MDRVYAFTDESGAFGWDIENPNVSTHFIITAIIVKESDLESFTQQAEALRKKHFQTGEIKSSNIGNHHARRLRVLADLQGSFRALISDKADACAGKIVFRIFAKQYACCRISSGGSVRSRSR